MPGYDRTGPNGQGPMTGRGMGYCAPADTYSRGRGLGRGFFGYGLRRGFPGGRGLGFGRGRGLGRGFIGNMPPEENIDSLSERIRKIEETLNK
ncbi:DUF5320 domain-containing protein [Candidatus Woesearchaeota archaeon]|nr:DUF5320 domain-containing protein [Candidatus Woesearchaeota archaeon]